MVATGEQTNSLLASLGDLINEKLPDNKSYLVIQMAMVMPRTALKINGRNAEELRKHVSKPQEKELRNVIQICRRKSDKDEDDDDDDESLL